MSLSNSLRAFLTVEWLHCSGGRSSSLGQLWREMGVGRRGWGGRGGDREEEVDGDAEERRGEHEFIRRRDGEESQLP